MKTIRAIAKLNIDAKNLTEFEKYAEQCVYAVKEKDQDTMQYDWYYNEDKSECIVFEQYKDSDAVLEHSANVAEFLGPLLAVSTLTLKVFGAPSQTLKKALEGFQVEYYNFELGL
ncbi:MAG: hypothetical protein HKN76_07585 [Saprospiraceae bacterium]|nr:hypothetical protein [Saprospiraceae bacterium]